MSDLGIPIPRVKPNGIFCAGCGETGRHAENCPSLRMSRIRIPQAYVETDALHEEIADLRTRLAALEPRVNGIDERVSTALGAIVELGARVDAALEAKRKK